MHGQNHIKFVVTYCFVVFYRTVAVVRDFNKLCFYVLNMHRYFLPNTFSAASSTVGFIRTTVSCWDASGHFAVWIYVYLWQFNSYHAGPHTRLLSTCLLLIKCLIYICSMAHACCVSAYIACSCVSFCSSDVAFAKVTQVGLLNILSNPP